jgi:hypothetical protein
MEENNDDAAAEEVEEAEVADQFDQGLIILTFILIDKFSS